MCLPYLAPVGSKWAAKQSVEVVEKFKTDVLMFSETGFLIICGDLNARTDVLNDYLSEEEVLTNEWLNSLNFDQEYNTLNKLKLPKRSSQDKGGLSGHGKALLELCKATNLKIVDGRAFQDKNIGKFTFHESRGSSVVDYLLADVKVWDLLGNFAVHDVSCKSDHCPIEFSICTEENISLNRDASVETMNVDCGDDSFKLIKSEKTDELVSSMVNDAKLSENLIELDKNLKEGIISPNNALSVLEQKLLNITDLLGNFAVHDVSCKSDHCPIEFSICTEENISLNRDASVETMNVDCGDDSFKLIKSEKTDELVSSMVNDAKLSENLIELDKNLKEGIISPNNALSVLEQKLLNITEHSMKKLKQIQSIKTI